MSEAILMVSGDMMLASEAESLAKKEMIECLFVSYGDHLTDLVKRTNPLLLVVDFSSQESDWVLKHLSEIKEERNDFPVVGVISGTLESDTVRLQRAGCDYVVARQQFEKKFPAILEKHFR